MSEETTRIPPNVVEAFGVRGLLNAMGDVVNRLNTGDGGVLTRPLISPGGAAEVIKAMIQVMKKVQTIEKLGHNKSDDYWYVRAVDLQAKLQDALALNGLLMMQREVDKVIKGKVILIKYQFDFWHESGQYVLNMAANSGSCRFEFKSGTQDDKAPGKAHTAAAKIAVLSTFKIPADPDQDIEREVFTDPDGQLTGEDARRREPPPERTEAPAERPREERAPHPDDVVRDRVGRYESPPVDRRPPEDNGPPRDYDPETGEIYVPPPVDRRPPEDNGPPPGFDDAPPFGDPVGPPPPSDPSRPPNDFRRNVQALADSLKNAGTFKEADQIWVENADLIRGTSDVTYEHLRAAFESRWKEAPPAI